MPDKLALGLSRLDEALVTEGLTDFVRQHGPSWPSQLKKYKALPDASKGDPRVFTKQVLLLAGTLLTLAESDFNHSTSDVLALAHDLLSGLFTLNQWFHSVAERLENAAFFALSPARQLQTMACLFEDQARIIRNKWHKSIDLHYRHADALDPRVLLTGGPRTDSGGTVSFADAFEAKGEILEIILRYLFWKHQGSFGRPETGISPYGDQRVAEVFYLADVQSHLVTIWTAFQHLDWAAHTEEGATVFLPPSKRDYVLSQVAFLRRDMHLNQLSLTAFTRTAQADKNRQRYIAYLAKEISSHRKNWLKQLSPTAIRKALQPDSAFFMSLDALERQYLVNVREVPLGRGTHTFSTATVLVALRFLDTISEAYIQAVWPRGASMRAFEALCPIVSMHDLAGKLSASTSLSRKECTDILKLFTFTRQSTELEIWQQPLIPWNEESVILLPSIATAIDVYKFFESHLANSGFSFEERGPEFEHEVSSTLRRHGLSVSKIGRFTASDGLEVDFDLFARFGEYYIIGEAKCLKTPTELGQLHKPWPAISKGIAQVKRRCALLESDWERIRQHCHDELPLAPPNIDRVIPIVVTNILSYTGRYVEGVHICDLMCITRYFAGSPITKQAMVNGKFIGHEEVIRPIWRGDGPTGPEFIEYLHHPPQVAEMEKLLKPSLQFLSLPSERLKPLGYAVMLSQQPSDLDG